MAELLLNNSPPQWAPNAEAGCARKPALEATNCSQPAVQVQTRPISFESAASSDPMKRYGSKTCKRGKNSDSVHWMRQIVWNRSIEDMECCSISQELLAIMANNPRAPSLSACGIFSEARLTAFGGFTSACPHCLS